MQHISMPLEVIEPDDIRRYYAYLLGEIKLAVKTVLVKLCALRFLYIKVLKRRDMKEDLPYPKERKQLPVVLSPAEVARLLGSARKLHHRAMLMMLYATGLRRVKMCRVEGGGHR